MGSRYEVEVTVGSARDLKNVNWRNGDLKPYAVLRVDDGAKCSTRVGLDNGDNPVWDEKLLIPLPPSSRIDDAVLYIDVVHANAAADVKPLVGSARLPLRDVLDAAGIRLELRVAVREAARYYHGPSPYAPPYGQSAGSRNPYAAPPPYGGYDNPYVAPPAWYPVAPPPYGRYDNPYVAPPAWYPVAYGAAAPAPAYGSAVEVDLVMDSYGGGGYPVAYGAAAPAPAYGSAVEVDLVMDSYGGGGYPVAYGAAAPAPAYGSAVEVDLVMDSCGGGYDALGGGDDDY